MRRWAWSNLTAYLRSLAASLHIGSATGDKGGWVSQGPGARKLVVFVHGLGGDAKSTWGNFPTLIAEDQDLADLDIFSWAYPSRLLRQTPSVWLAGRQLHTELRVRFIGYDRVYFVAHSLGGLVVRAMIIQALREAKATSLEQVSHVITFGTPNDGSEFALAVKALGLANSQLRALDVSGEEIGRLRGDWVNLVYAPDIRPGEELLKKKIPLTTIVGLDDQVVKPYSAISYFSNPPPEVVPGNHSSMKLPSDRTETSYLLVKRVVMGDVLSPAPVSSSLSPRLSGSNDELSFDQWIYALLALDQFESGVWGGSLENTGAFYGKGEDVGSISVSVKCCRSLLHLTGSRSCAPIGRFRQYLIEHRSAKGAYGMLRSVGSSAFPSIEIIENARHTAAAIVFFLDFDGPSHPYLLDAVKYLLDRDNQTTSGLWVDIGPRTNDRVDALTVAQVIESLSCFLRSGASIDQEEVKGISDAIDRGLDYIFSERVRTEDGYWLYRYANEQERLKQIQNVYRHTAGVLACIASTIHANSIHYGLFVDLGCRLVDIALGYGGLPDSPNSDVPNLSATLNLLKASRQISSLTSFQDALIQIARELCLDHNAVDRGNASGWASIADFRDTLPKSEGAILDGLVDTARLNIGVPALVHDNPKLRSLAKISEWRERLDSAILLGSGS